MPRNRDIVVDPVLGDLTHDRLTRDVSVWQRRRGHRFSSDDVVTAHVAVEARPNARRYLDLGTGLGSVLLIVLWRLPDAVGTGVEAQAMSYSLLQRNVEGSGFSPRITTLFGDFREALTDEGPFDLITGTPPYFPPGAAACADDEQRTFARIERRGGVEAYLEAAAPRLAEGGALVLCGDARAERRVVSAAPQAGLHLVGAVDVIPKAGKAPLFRVWTLVPRRAGAEALAAGDLAPLARRTMTLRDAEGNTTEDAARLRAFSGFSST